MFTFPVDVEDLFSERASQIAAWGIPRVTVARVRARIRDMWTDASGGWTYEWSQEAARAEDRREWLLASALHGAARFPVACTPARVEAQRRQVACYLEASRTFSTPFERRSVSVLGAAGATGPVDVPVHLFGPRRTKSAPLVLLSGGVDTGKMELHRLAIGLALSGLRVAAIDMPGTGETAGPLSPGSHGVYVQVLDALSRDGSRPLKRGILGISFGGHWAAKLALLGVVDAAVDVGGPIGAEPADGASILRLPRGMPGILANALGMDGLPTADEAVPMMNAFSLREQGLLGPGRLRVPLLVLNGANDPYVPQTDTSVFRQYPAADVFLLEGADHCAADRFLRVAPALVVWIRMQLVGGTLAAQAMYGVARALLPPSV
jgi:esterase FrsA